MKNVVEWESAEHFLQALRNPQLQKIAAQLPVTAFPNYPALYEVVRS